MAEREIKRQRIEAKISYLKLLPSDLLSFIGCSQHAVFQRIVFLLPSENLYTLLVKSYGARNAIIGAIRIKNMNFLHWLRAKRYRCDYGIYKVVLGSKDLNILKWVLKDHRFFHPHANLIDVVALGDVEIAKYLVEFGYKPRRGQDLLTMALSNGHSAMAQWLYEEKIQPVINVDILLAAVKGGNIEAGSLRENRRQLSLSAVEWACGLPHDYNIQRAICEAAKKDRSDMISFIWDQGYRVASSKDLSKVLSVTGPKTIKFLAEKKVISKRRAEGRIAKYMRRYGGGGGNDD